MAVSSRTMSPDSIVSTGGSVASKKLRCTVDGAATTSVSGVQVDTSVGGTHYVRYFAIDQNGVMGEATRTIIVGTGLPADTATSTTSVIDTTATSTDPVVDTTATSTATSTDPAPTATP